jgi:hypothetical protein
MSRPTRRHRLLFALLIAVVAAGFATSERLRVGSTHSDFAPVWYGARAILTGVNPYRTFGPGLEFEYDGNLFYPVPAMLAALPLGFLPEDLASVVFIALSAGLVAYAATRESWNMVWVFPSSAFIVAVRACQWAPLMGATMFLPALAWMYSFKPNIGFSIAASTDSKRALIIAVAGTAILSAIGLAIIPSWPVDWFLEVREGTQTELTAPIMRPLGFLVLLTLLRWRQPEARYLLVFACIPQTASWYELFTLLLLARTKREAQLLSIVSSLGYVAQIALLEEGSYLMISTVGVLMMVFGYLPALVVIMLRGNVGEPPAWYGIVRDSVSRLRAA